MQAELPHGLCEHKLSVCHGRALTRLMSLQINGIEEDDLSTTSVSVSPQTTYNQQTGNSEQIGFQYENSVSVRVRLLLFCSLSELILLNPPGLQSSLNSTFKLPLSSLWILQVFQYCTVSHQTSDELKSDHHCSRLTQFYERFE